MSKNAFKEELNQLYGDMHNEETYIYINISLMELPAFGCIFRILGMNNVLALMYS